MKDVLHFWPLFCMHMSAHTPHIHVHTGAGIHIGLKYNVVQTYNSTTVFSNLPFQQWQKILHLVKISLNGLGKQFCKLNREGITGKETRFNIIIMLRIKLQQFLILTEFFCLTVSRSLFFPL